MGINIAYTKYGSKLILNNNWYKQIKKISDLLKTRFTTRYSVILNFVCKKQNVISPLLFFVLVLF